jgi:hypothetical protein
MSTVTSPALLELRLRPLKLPQLCLEVIDVNQDWEVRKFIRREDVDSVLHYLVECA